MVRCLVWLLRCGLACAITCVCLSDALSAQPGRPVEQLFYNARVFTADPRRPSAEAVAIRGDTFVAVGTRTDALAAVSVGAEQHDLHGRTLLPGLIDSHVHPILGGFILNSPVASEGFGDDKPHSVADVVAVTRAALRSHTGFRGDILMISWVPLQVWSKAEDLDHMLSRGDFERVPVLLWGNDGHTGWANRPLRLRVGLTADFIAHLSPDERANFGVTAMVEPNGFAVDDGLGKIVAALPRQTREERLIWARAAVRYLNSFGITAVLDAQADLPTLNNYKDLSERGDLTLHVAAFPVVNAPQPGADPLARVMALQRQFAGIKNLTMPGIKMYADGVAEYPSQTAAMSAPYKNTGRYGPLLLTPAQFAQIVTAADRAGLVVHIHAVGDKAVTASLDSIAAARAANGDSGLPHTIAHLQFVAVPDVGRFKPLGVIADVQLIWAAANFEAVELVKPYIDPVMYVRQYPARSLWNAGATIAGGSDWYASPVPNPFLAIAQAETRRGPEGVLNARERMPREAMLYAYTRNAAMAMHQLTEIGSIEVGKKADFVVVDRDVLHVSPDALKHTRVLLTAVGGQTVFGSSR